MNSITVILIQVRYKIVSMDELRVDDSDKQ